MLLTLAVGAWSYVATFLVFVAVLCAYFAAWRLTIWCVVNLVEQFNGCSTIIGRWLPRGTV